MIELARAIAKVYGKHRVGTVGFNADLLQLALDNGYPSGEALRAAITKHAATLGTVYSLYISSAATLEEQYYAGRKFNKLKKDLMSRSWV